MQTIREANRKSFLSDQAITFLILAAVLITIPRWNGIEGKQQSFDEGVYHQLGYQLMLNPTHYSLVEYYRYLKEELKDPRTVEYLNAPLFKHPPLYSYLISLSYRLFGVKTQAALFVSMFFAIATAFVVFYLASLAFDRRCGLLAALFLLMDPVHWLCSQKIWIETTYVFFVYLGLLLLVIGLEKKSQVLIFSGIAFGLSFVSKYFAALPYVGVLLFLILQPSLPPKKHFLLFLAMPLAVLSPWILWNMNVYGPDLLTEVIKSQQHTYSEQSQIYLMRYAMIAGTALLLFLTLAALRIFADAFLEKPKAFAQKFIANRTSRKALTILALALCVIAVYRWVNPKAFLFTYEANLTQEMNFFWKEPRTFYLTRLPELSPVYIFSFLSILFIAQWKKYSFLLLFTALTTIIFVSRFGAYETRYILAAMPALLVLASDMLVRTYDMLKASPLHALRTLRWLIPLATIYLAAKVLWFDLRAVNSPGVWFQL